MYNIPLSTNVLPILPLSVLYANLIFGSLIFKSAVLIIVLLPVLPSTIILEVETYMLLLLTLNVFDAFIFKLLLVILTVLLFTTIAPAVLEFIKEVIPDVLL